jgi:hypothetical protein
MKLFLQFSQSPTTSFLVRVLPQYLFDTLSLCSSPTPQSVSDKAAHSYKTEGKITELHILILIRLDSIQDKQWTQKGSKRRYICHK